MTSIISNAICCAGNCVCHAMNNICSDTMKINPKLFSKIGFIIINLLGVAISLIILFFGSNLLQPFNKHINCPESNNLDCLGISQVYRMSFSLAILHFVVIFFSLCGKNVASVINRHCWTFKLLLVFGIYIAFLFVPNSFFSVYAEISKYISFLFIVFQVLVTISFAHIINIKLVEGLDNENEAGKYQFWLIFLSLIFGGLSVYWIVLSFMNYSYNFWNIFIICISILLSIGFTYVSISHLVERKRLLTSLYMFSFVSYLCWSALNSQPNEKRKENTLLLSVIDVLVGMFYLVMALSYVGFHVKDSDKAPRVDEKEGINQNPLVEDAKSVPSEEEENDLSKSHYYFHIFMIFMSIYYCMILTNWNVIDPNVIDPKILPTSWSSFWIKLSAMLVSTILYVWVMIAPRLFPDREFDF
jgi:serine incorporator 1/3